MQKIKWHWAGGWGCGQGPLKWWPMIFEGTEGMASRLRQRDVATTTICICFHLPICIVKLHSHILHLQWVSLTNSTYKISISKQGKVLNHTMSSRQNFYNFFLYKPVQTSYSFHGSMVESWRLSSARHEAATSRSCRRREAKVHLSNINTRNEVGFKLLRRV